MGKAELTKQKIVESAALVFNRKGYAGTSIRDLTDATGLTKGSIYGNFQDKEEVAAEALKHNLSIILRAFREEIEGLTNSVDQLLAYPRAYRKIFRQILDRGGCPLVNTLSEADDTRTGLSRIAGTMIRQWRRNIIKTLEQGKRRGEVRPDVDSALFAESMLALIEGGSFLGKATGKVSYITNSIRFLETLIEDIRA